MVISGKRKLGKGLEAVLSKASNQQIPTNSLCPEKAFPTLSVEQIIPGKYQPRKEFFEEELQSLANSIKEKGVLQPILVRHTGDAGYELIAGERRWRAAQIAGLKNIPAIIYDISDEEALAFGLIENIQRQELNPIEEAEAIQRLIQEFVMTHEKVAQMLGRSRTMVSNLLRLLNLTPKVRDMLISKLIDMGHARALLALEGEQQEALAARVIKQKLSVRQTEKLVKQACQHRDIKPLEHESHRYIAQAKQWSSRLTQHLSTEVTVKCSKTGKGRVVIETYSIEMLEKLIERLTNIADT